MKNKNSLILPFVFLLLIFSTNTQHQYTYFGESHIEEVLLVNSVEEIIKGNITNSGAKFPEELANVNYSFRKARHR